MDQLGKTHMQLFLITGRHREKIGPLPVGFLHYVTNHTHALAILAMVVIVIIIFCANHQVRS